MTKKDKRFELTQYNFQDLNAVIYDNLEDKEIHLSIFALVNLLNTFAQKEYDLLRLRKGIDEIFDKLIDGDSDD